MENLQLTKETIENMSELAGFTTHEQKQAVLFGVGLAFGTTCGAMLDLFTERAKQAEEAEKNYHHNPSMRIVNDD